MCRGGGGEGEGEGVKIVTLYILQVPTNGMTNVVCAYSITGEIPPLWPVNVRLLVQAQRLITAVCAHLVSCAINPIAHAALPRKFARWRDD